MSARIVGGILTMPDELLDGIIDYWKIGQEYNWMYTRIYVMGMNRANIFLTGNKEISDDLFLLESIAEMHYKDSLT